MWRRMPGEKIQNHRVQLAVLVAHDHVARIVDSRIFCLRHERAKMVDLFLSEHIAMRSMNNENGYFQVPGSVFEAAHRGAMTRLPAVEKALVPMLVIPVADLAQISL